MWLMAAQATCLIATVLWWHLRVHTNLAGQYHPRTVMAVEGFPLIAISVAILTIHIPASWMVATSPRRLDAQAIARALVAVVPCIQPHKDWQQVLRSLPPGMIPGIDSLELVEFVPVQLQLPWAFFLSLMPLLMLGAGFGLLLEAAAGRGFGSLGPLVTYGLVVAVQSHGHLDFLAGSPGQDISLTWQGWVLLLWPPVSRHMGLLEGAPSPSPKGSAELNAWEAPIGLGARVFTAGTNGGAREVSLG